jgi:hypothetical protein
MLEALSVNPQVLDRSDRIAPLVRMSAHAIWNFAMSAYHKGNIYREFTQQRLKRNITKQITFPTQQKAESFAR